MSKFYEVYVGNLSVKISAQNLKDLFAAAGEIGSVWIKCNFKEVTYGFVGFCYLEDAEKACKTFHEKQIDGFILCVRLSNKTRKELNNCVRPRRDGSILLQLPKNPGLERNKLAKILKRDLITATNHNKEFINDYVSALREMDNISCTPCKEVKAEFEETDLQTLEDIFLRYHYQPINKKKNREIDIDLSKNKVLTSELNAKYFDIAFK